MQDLRVAVVGYGLSGSVFHAPLIASTEGLAVATVVTGNSRRQEQVRRDHPDADVLSDADLLWDRPAEHDLVVIAAANDVHTRLAREGLDAGLPVVVDKPVAPTAAEARDLIQHADKLGLLLTVFQNRRWDSDQRTLRKLITSGELGEILRYESRFERWRPRLAPGRVWRESTPAAQGGGVLLDLGSHLVDQALVLFGPVTHAYAEIDHRRGGVSDDDDFLALRHQSGVLSHLWASAVAGAPGPRLRVLGPQAAYVVSELDGQEDALRSGLHPRGSDTWGVEPESRWGRLVRGEQTEPVASERGTWPCFYSGVARSLRDGVPPPVDPRDAAATLDVLEAARRSAGDRSVVPMPTATG